MAFPYSRINVIGTSGSGKTTFAKTLAECLNVPHIEQDSIYWKANWENSTDDEFIKKAQPLYAADAWVSDGNYSRFRSLTWDKVQLVIWLDYPFVLVFWRGLKRSLQGVLFRRELWHGNIESFRLTFLSKDSILLWILTTYKRRKKTISELMNDPENNDIDFLRFTSPYQAKKWLEDISC